MSDQLAEYLTTNWSAMTCGHPVCGLTSVRRVVDGMKVELCKECAAKGAWAIVAMLGAARAAAEARIAELEAAARALYQVLPEAEIDIAHFVWGNTNTALVLAARRELAALVEEAE